MEGKNESKHTPKWRWILNESSKTVRLESTESGRDTIMDFVRYGMTWAQPRFNVDGIMIKAEELGETVEGREHHAEWFKFINHPTAKLIESIPALLEENERLKLKLSTAQNSIDQSKEERNLAIDSALAIRQSLQAEVDRLTKEKKQLVEAIESAIGLTSFLGENIDQPLHSWNLLAKSLLTRIK